MLEAFSPNLSLPSLTSKEWEELKEFWKIYEIHREKLVAEFLRVARERPEFKYILQNGFFLQSTDGGSNVIEIQRRAIFHGEWEPFLKELMREGVLYAQAGLNIPAWFRIVAVSRDSLISILLEEYMSLPDRLLPVFNGMALFFNLVTATISEGYLWGKEQLRLLQKEILQESEERFRLVVEAAPSAMIVVDRNGLIVLTNASAQSLFGYAPDELLGKPVEMLVPERFRTGHRRFRDGFIAQPAGRPMGAGRDLYGLHKDGLEIPIEIGLTPYESSGEIFTLALIVDITERKRTEEALRASEQLYHSTLDNMMEGAQIVDFDWRYRYVNDAVVRQGRETRENMIDHRMQDVYPGIEHTKMFATLERCMRERTSERLVNEFAYPNGDRRWFDLSIQPIREGIFILSIDITERIKAEKEVRQLNEDLEKRVTLRTAQLEAANKELESFAYSVSHDLRAPLRSIDGFSLALLEDHLDSLPEEGRDYLQRIRAAAQRMAQLIDDLLDLSRVSRSVLERSPVDLSTLAIEIVEELRRSEPGREIDVSIAPALKTSADGRLMKIVLENLLGNAWKFTARTRQARIEFGARQSESGPIFFVRDNGSGFDMAYKDKLFGAFQRLHSASDFPGSGIGLAIVQRIIHRHGGEIWAEGASNQGAAFYFTI